MRTCEFKTLDLIILEFMKTSGIRCGQRSGVNFINLLSYISTNDKFSGIYGPFCTPSRD